MLCVYIPFHFKIKLTENAFALRGNEGAVLHLSYRRCRAAATNSHGIVLVLPTPTKCIKPTHEYTNKELKNTAQIQHTHAEIYKHTHTHTHTEWCPCPYEFSLTTGENDCFTTFITICVSVCVCTYGTYVQQTVCSNVLDYTIFHCNTVFKASAACRSDIRYTQCVSMYLWCNINFIHILYVRGNEEENRIQHIHVLYKQKTRTHSHTKVKLQLNGWHPRCLV